MRLAVPTILIGVLTGAAATGAAPRGDEPRALWTFADVTADSGIDFVYTFGDQEFSFILEDTGSGVALIDVDGDDLLDVYFLNGCALEGISQPPSAPRDPARNRLYRNLGQMRFTEVTDAAGVGDPGYGMGAVVGDYDGDGDEDLYVLNWGPNVLYRNRGDGSFEDVTEAAGVAGPAQLSGQVKWSVNGFFFDPDRDGDLDLYVANYLAFDPQFVDPELPEEYPYPGPESYAGQASTLYRNDGTGRFHDATTEVGLDAFPAKTMGACAADFDGDGNLEIFEAADDAGNLLLRWTDPGRFVDVAVDAGVAFDRSGAPMASMHASIADCDGDGLLDVFVPDLARGCLYRNRGALTFEEIGAAAGLAEVLDGSGAWGSCWGDFDNDGNVDLLVVLGGAFDLAAAEGDRLFLGDGSGHFRDVSAALGGYFEQQNVSRGAAFGDLDNDGDLDFVVSRKDLEGSPHVVRNDLGAPHHWLGLKLRGTRSNRDGIGARVELRAGGLTQVREVGRAGSYLSQNDPRVHFGLGEKTGVESLTIRWPSGLVQDLEVDRVDAVLSVVEPAEEDH